MLKQIKTALVKSFVGAIAVGWLFAETINRFITSLTAPLANWWTMLRAQQQNSSGYSGILPPRPNFPFEIALSQLIGAALLLLITSLLFRWLFLEVPDASKSGETPYPEPKDATEQGA